MADKIKELALRMKDEPNWFIKDVLGRILWSKQREVIDSVYAHKRTTVKACHSVGKSFLAGNLILHFLYSYKPSIVLSTAPTWRQVEKLIWKEVRASYDKSRIPLGGNLLPKSPELQIIQDQWYAAGLSTNDSNKFQGFHERNILIIVDEAAGVAEEIFEGIEGPLASENARLLLLGNPTSTSGEFFKSFKDSSYNHITIDAFCSPNFKQTGITEEDIMNGDWKEKVARVVSKRGSLVSPSMITPEWVADKYKRWKPGSPLYDSKVRGQFPSQGTDSLIPLAWIELAMARWYEMEDTSKIRKLGVDVAEYGSDYSSLAPLYGDKVMPLETHNDMGIMELTGHVVKKFREMETCDSIKIDVIGIGTGVEGRLTELGFPAIRVNVSESPGVVNEEDEDEKEEMKLFLNKRSQLYWCLRERLNPDKRINPRPISLPPDDELASDLSSIKYKINSAGKIQIESKADLRKRLGRSPDKGDSVMLAVAPDELLMKKKDLWEPNIR